MKTSTVLLLLAFTALGLASAKSAGTVVPAEMSGQTTQAADPPTTNSTTPPPTTNSTTPPPTTNSTTAPPTTNSTTAPPTTNSTTPPPTTNSTTAPPTTNSTTAPPTTNSTTAPPTTNSTTAPPTTNSTTAAPTTTKPPTTANGTVGNYTINNGAQRCLMAQMELKVHLNSDKDSKIFVLFPNKTSTAGYCKENEAVLVLRSDDFNCTMSFIRNLTSQTTYVNALSFTLVYNFTKEGSSARNEVPTYSVNNKTLQLFSAKIGNSYSCKKELLYMGQGLYLHVNQDRMQAFNFSKTNEFGLNDPCPADQNNYRVAIAVGITLLVLVIVVVVAYLLARKRRTGGYQSL